MRLLTFAAVIVGLANAIGCAEGGESPPDCPSEEIPELYILGVTRVPLDAFVQSGFPSTITDEPATDCNVDPAMLDGGAATDAGIGPCASWNFDWVRTEGCGLVRYVTPPGRGGTTVRVYELDAGTLVGAALTSDVFFELAGTECLDGAYVGGSYPVPDCADETVTCCLAP